MKTLKKINNYFLHSAFCLIIIVSLGLTSMTGTVTGKSYNHSALVPGESLQAKSKYRFVGAEKCASVCHNNDTMGFQYNSWKNSLHSEAFNILGSKKAVGYAKKAHIRENPQECSACLKCHISGEELDSSYFTSTYKKEDGVTCEACHKTISDGKTYLPVEADCIKCHNNSLHKMNGFSFPEEYAKIAHPSNRTLNRKAVKTDRGIY